MRSIIVILALLTTQSVYAEAQLIPLPPGQRIRVMIPSTGNWYTGRVVSADSDTILLDVDGANRSAIAVPSLTRLQVRSGEGSRWAAGLAIGAAVGAAVGTTLAAIDTDENDSQRGWTIVGFGGLGAAVLGQIGWAIGASIKTEHWDEVVVPRVSVDLRPVEHHRLGVIVSLAF